MMPAWKASFSARVDAMAQADVNSLLIYRHRSRPARLRPRSVSAMVGVGVGFESAGQLLAAFRCLYVEQQAMKTEGCAEGTDFVHPESPRATRRRRRGRTVATAPCDGGSMTVERALSLARLAASRDASDGD